MNFLLDTGSFLWVTLNPERLGNSFLKCFRNTSNTTFLSSLTAWEINIKCSIGKLALPATPNLFIPQERKNHQIPRLDLCESDTFHLGNLPPLHKDPFDRMLVSQAIERSLTILTPDLLIRQYPIRTLC